MNRIYTIDIFELKSKMFDCAVAMLENEDITNDAVRDKLETLSEINGIIGDIFSHRLFVISALQSGAGVAAKVSIPFG